MANKTEIKAMVAKILRCYPQMKYDTEAIQGFVDELAPKLERFPGWLLIEAADRFAETELDFPRFNIASLLNYCVMVHNEEMSKLYEKHIELKMLYYDERKLEWEDWMTLAQSYKDLGFTKGMKEIEKEYAEFLARKDAPLVSQEKIKEGREKLDKLLEKMGAK